MNINQIDNNKIAAFVVLAQTLLMPWQESNKEDAESLLALAIALETVAAEIRLQAALLFPNSAVP